ncbi:MAG: hypothetical protein M9938_10830 [Solirubrobacterales bacterium]|nr:hypothetical protein [Solirubrobacterales bacterium]
MGDGTVWPLAHEITHQWFGDSVTGTTWRDLWIQEGWATWGEWWWDHTYNGSSQGPADYFTTFYTPGPGVCPANKWCLPPAAATALTLSSYFQTYLRPGIMFEAQRQIMGESAFQNLITQWQTRHKYGNAGKAEWIGLTKEMDGNTRNERWDQFFAQWLDGTTMPTINPGNFDTP